MRPHQRFVNNATVMAPLGEQKRFWVARFLKRINPFETANGK
jgi:hypothetical protein